MKNNVRWLEIKTRGRINVESKTSTIVDPFFKNRRVETRELMEKKKKPKVANKKKYIKYTKKSSYSLQMGKKSIGRWSVKIQIYNLVCGGAIAGFKSSTL